MKLKTLHLLGYLCFNILIILSLNIIKLNAKNYKINSNKKISGAPKVQVCLPEKNNGKVKRDITICHPVEPPHIPALDYESFPGRTAIHSVLHSLFDSVEDNALAGSVMYPIVPNPSQTGVSIDTIPMNRPVLVDRSNYMWHIGLIQGTVNYVIMSSQTHTVLEENPDNNSVELQPENLNRLNRYQQWYVETAPHDGFTLAVLINAGSGRVLSSRLDGSLITEDHMLNDMNVEELKARHAFYLLPERDTDQEIDPRRF